MPCRILSASIFRCTLVLAVAMTPLPGRADVFTVNYAGDLPDSVPGNGICSSFVDGTCSLRAAVMESNANPGFDFIFLETGQMYFLSNDGIDDTAEHGDLDILDDVNILYFGAEERPVVDVGESERAFEIFDAAVSISNFDITGGDATLPGDAYGGAIAVDFDADVVQLIRLRLYGNQAEFGGAVYNDGPSTHIRETEFYDNITLDNLTNSGGLAIYNRGVLDIEQCSVFDNGTPGNAGSAILNAPPNVGVANLEIHNSTIANNYGTGVRNDFGSQLYLENVTSVGNLWHGVRLNGNGGYLLMRNTIVASNGSFDCLVNLTATFNNDNHNLDSDNSCELSSGSSNYPGVEPYLTPLARHGGFTHASWPLWLANSNDSPVIDKGHPAISVNGCDPEDQHGTVRPVDFDDSGSPRCDIGAVEMSDDVIFFDPMELLAEP